MVQLDTEIETFEIPNQSDMRQALIAQFAKGSQQQQQQEETPAVA